MMYRSSLLRLALLVLLAACTSRQEGMPLRHPADAGLSRTPPLCTDCHETRSDRFDFAGLNHTPAFRREHRVEARQAGERCELCHTVAFCNDCHALQVELQPAEKHPAETFRTLPHRGDYLARHRIDARLDPISCQRCHGNPKNSRSCSPCHG